MTRGNYANRVDANQKEIVSFLRQLGVFVLNLSMVGKGCPDLLLGFKNGSNILVEIKDGNKHKSAQKLTEAEALFHETWPNEVYVINSVEDAFKLVTKIKYSSKN